MTNDAMDRLRNADPAHAYDHDHEGLFDAIVATPGDPRLRSNEPRSQLSRRRLRIAVAFGALAVGVGAAWAAVGGPLELFQTNPQGRDASPASLWDQDVLPSSVVQAAVLAIPKYGEVEFWYADAHQGGWCGAIRLPNGSWAGMKDSGIGGTAPGCYPTREQTNAMEPTFLITGFDYYEVQVDARGGGGTFWRIYYGLVSTETPAAAVVDRTTGRHARVHEGKLFGIAVPDPRPDAAAPSLEHALDLVAYDAAGNVLAEERPDGG